MLHLIDSAGMYGAEKVVITLLDELKDTDFPGILGCIREREDETPHIATEAITHNIPVRYFTMKRGFNLSGIMNISKYVRDNKITVVHSHGYKPNIFLHIVSSKRLKKISTVHGWSKETAHLKTRLYEYLDALALKRMNCIIAVSKAVEKDLIKRGLQKEKIEIIYNGINVNHARNASHLNTSQLLKEYEIPPGTFVIGTLGRLAIVKGHSYLIQAIPSILKEIPGCMLLIAGSGPLYSNLNNLIKALGLENNIKLIGYIKELEPFFSSIDLFVLPSLSEGLPISLLEAMRHGKPCVASAAGGITEIITDGAAGLLVPPANVKALAQAITSLYKDEGRMKQLSANGQKLVECNFSAKSMANQYEALYSKIVACET